MNFSVRTQPSPTTAQPAHPTGPSVQTAPQAPAQTAAPTSPSAYQAARQRSLGTGTQPVQAAQGGQLAKAGIDAGSSGQISEQAGQLLSSPSLAREFGSAQRPAPFSSAALTQAREGLKPISQHAVLQLGGFDQTVSESARSVVLKDQGSSFAPERMGPDATLDIVAHGSSDGKTLGGQSPAQLAQTLKSAGITHLAVLDLKSCHSDGFKSALAGALREAGIEVGEIRTYAGQIAIDRQTGKALQGTDLARGQDGTLGKLSMGQVQELSVKHKLPPGRILEIEALVEAGKNAKFITKGDPGSIKVIGPLVAEIQKLHAAAAAPAAAAASSSDDDGVGIDFDSMPAVAAAAAAPAPRRDALDAHGIANPDSAAAFRAMGQQIESLMFKHEDQAVKARTLEFFNSLPPDVKEDAAIVYHTLVGSLNLDLHRDPAACRQALIATQALISGTETGSRLEELAKAGLNTPAQAAQLRSEYQHMAQLLIDGEITKGENFHELLSELLTCSGRARSFAAFQEGVLLDNKGPLIFEVKNDKQYDIDVGLRNPGGHPELSIAIQTKNINGTAKLAESFNLAASQLKGTPPEIATNLKAVVYIKVGDPSELDAQMAQLTANMRQIPTVALDVVFPNGQRFAFPAGGLAD